MTYNKKMRRTLAVVATGIVLGGMTAQAGMYQMASNYVSGTAAPYNSGGGVPAAALLTLNTNTSTNVTLSWYGMQGWYGVEGSTNLTDWIKLGSVESSDFATMTTVTNPFGSSASFRLSQSNSFAGSGACGGCHGDKYNEYMGTAHASALSSIMNPDGSFSGHAKQSCLPCHTVGNGQPTGYVYTTNAASFTSPLANVGCENCHGPAGWHKNSDHAAIHPAVSLDPTICGSCHQGHNPQYTEYSTTLHAGPAHSTALSCGPCHSAANRMAMLNEWEDMQAGRPHALEVPSSSDAAAWTAVCVTCHDPHSAEIDPQLRNPMRSTNFYTMPSVADGNNNTTFDTFYDPNVQICGQCHNTRGVRWDGLKYVVLVTNVISGPVTNTVQVDVYTTTYTTNIVYGQPKILTNTYVSGRYTTNLITMNTNSVRYTGLTNSVDYSRGPHHAPQYNILIGILQEDYLNTNSFGVATNFVARHGVGVSSSGVYNTNQCATCHVPSYTGPNGNIAGHTFQLDPNGCALGGCHGSFSSHGTPGAPDYVDYGIENSNLMVSLADLLNTWATNKAEAVIGTTDYNKSLQNSWEYSNIGELATITNAGPSATKQLLLPEAIRQARYNLYSVFNDSSFGVHNPKYVPFLLSDAEAKVLNLLPVQFIAKATSAGPGDTITFSNLTSGVTSAAWDFGDGGSSTDPSASVTHVYTNAGVYTVSLTVNGADNLTRNGYIHIYDLPTPSYTCGTATNHPATLMFTNTSVNANYGNWAFYNGTVSNANGIGGKASPTDMSQFFTFTNAGAYTVVFTASSPGGSAKMTNTITVP